MKSHCCGERLQPIVDAHYLDIVIHRWRCSVCRHVYSQRVRRPDRFKLRRNVGNYVVTIEVARGNVTLAELEAFANELLGKR